MLKPDGLLRFIWYNIYFKDFVTKTQVQLYIYSFKLKRLSELRRFCDDLSVNEYRNAEQLRLTEEELDSIEKIKLILENFAEATTKLQSDVLTLSDFYGIWGLLIVKTKRFKDEHLAQMLLSEMNKRGVDLMNN